MLALVKALQITLSLVAVANVGFIAWVMIAGRGHVIDRDLAHHRAMWLLLWASLATYFVPVAIVFVMTDNPPVIVVGVPQICRITLLGGVSSAGTFFLAAYGVSGAPRIWSRFFAITAIEMLLVGWFATSGGSTGGPP